VLVQDLGLVPGNRVLLRGGNSIGMALAWLAVVKAGLVAVASMPLLRAKELGDIIDKAQPTVALCDARLQDELQLAQARTPGAADHRGLQPHERCPVHWRLRCGTARMAALRPAPRRPTTSHCWHSPPAPPASPRRRSTPTATCWRPARPGRDMCCKATPDDIVMGSPPLAFTFGLGGLLVFPMWAGASVYIPDQRDRSFRSIVTDDSDRT
jgi:2-aminobenzoate-CoA ligase